MSGLSAAADPRRRDRALNVDDEKAGAEPLLDFDRVSKWYGPVIGLNDVTLRLGRGMTGLVGPNGAGKSTLMKLATGQLRADLGRVSVAGHDGRSAAARSRLGFCPETDA